MDVINKIFVAIPYTGTSEVRVQRHALALTYCATLVRLGYAPMCPIGMFHQVVDSLNDDVPYEAWIDISLAYLKGCSRIHLITADGWQNSVGVGLEMKAAFENNISVFLVSPDKIEFDSIEYDAVPFDPRDHNRFNG